MEVIFEQMNEVISNPGWVVKKYKEETGKKAIGCFPVYCPEEIIHAAGMLPVGIWGGQTDLELAKQYFPAFACSIMQSCLEYGLKGTYDDLAAVIIPGMCDTLICMGQNWKVGVPQVEYIALVHPQNRKIQAGITYLKSEYANVKKKLEEIGGIEISNEAINNSIAIYNEHRKTMREFVEVAANYPNVITPLKRNIVIKSGYFMEKGKHTALVKELMDEIVKKPVGKWNGKKVLLSGILADSKELLSILEENNMAVIADDLAQETRQFRCDVPEGEDALDRLARHWSIFEGCSLVYDPEKKRGSIIVDEIKNKGIDGVVFCMMKFCDPEEYDYPLVKKEIEDAGIPTLYLEIDQQMENNEQARTRIQTFAEILSS
ncbi:2-hydroxyacyl-CoA dehydratase subunit D [Crassaminicella profunda]|uniref:2-hydroxyacyl-CoA dehydratase subunit D n=1 Tax=Crassaminicella profunda TaxID=1286698 RepID=UPI001CA61C81|nr:2-hydroxyacyl-CoA dehydratase family protein [Crassaminicella profunda]QZY57526.1 2-hydroxyacyl-CoA dehydratase family protein [Crassaminicella profunda]